MTSAEVVLWVEGFEHCHDLAGQMMAHFFSYLGTVSGNWGKRKRPPKARDLWNSRRKRPEKEKNVVDLAEHRRWSEAFKETGPPPIFRRGGLRLGLPRAEVLAHEREERRAVARW